MKGEHIMKIEKYHLVLVMVTVILCGPTFGQTEPPIIEDGPVLIGQANPTLAGIDKLYVSITQVGEEPNKDGLVWEKLRNKVKNKLKDSGIKIVSGKESGYPINIPDLRINVNMLKLDDSQQYVFSIQTLLGRQVYLTKESSLSIRAIVRKIGPILEVSSVKSMPFKVTDVVFEQVEAFTNAYLVANPKSVKTADVNDANNVTPIKIKRRVKTAAKSKAAKKKYVASKNSKIFHKARCNWAERIKQKNIVRFNSGADAVKAGKRPCKQCKP